MKRLDYIIVGNGIAGAVLSYSLIKRDRSVLVIDNPSLSQSSKVAAGLYNPIVFKRLMKSWMANEIFPFAENFYQDAENIFQAKFLHKKEIVKLFAEENEKSFWINKLDSDAGKYLSKDIHPENYFQSINNSNGSANVLNAGYLDIKSFIQKNTEQLKKLESYTEESFEYDEISFEENGVSYKNYSASKIIFCEGCKAIDNPFFNWLDFKLTKGEVLTVKIPNLKMENIINKGVFILPLGNDLYKVGATYEWNDLTEKITDKGKSELKNKLEKIIQIPFEIILHEAGIRPTVKDRRPLIGIHPMHKQLAIFNGMGTKGVVIAPYFAEKLFEHIEKNKSLLSEVDANRFFV